ncbi:hypothetical protein OCU04_003594 [Sclerotinia nivalis]|uniref:Uncharacterized protein n=1 Tax=Sclerotinia nivalis TaxID=352851 RepID=A0A9X0AS91_9HELO|nr:hypothetical protein OCU04_003594 [Sclerotinia nivalis]
MAPTSTSIPPTMTSTEKKKVPLTIVQLHCNYHDTIIWLLIGTPPSLYNTLHHPRPPQAPPPQQTPAPHPPTSTPPPPPPSCTTSSSSPASSSHSSTSSASAPNSGNSALNHAKSP